MKVKLEGFSKYKHLSIDLKIIFDLWPFAQIMKVKLQSK